MFVQPQTLKNPGGAFVRRRFNTGGKDLIAGTVLSQADLAAIPEGNLRALLNTGKLELFPAPPARADGEAAERFAIHRGCGRYDVIEGVKLNKEQLSKDEADILTGKTDHEA